MIPPKITDFVFHSAFLMSFARRTETCLEFPVRAKGNESFGLLTLASLKDLFDGAPKIVIPTATEGTAVVMKRMLMPIEKGLLRRMEISAMEGRATSHAPHVENLNRYLLLCDLDHGLVPIDLSLDSE